MDKNEEEIIQLNNHHELLNTSFDEYKIKRLIKETGKDFVFEAFDTRLNRLVALKVLKPGQSKEREEQFFREGQKLASIGKFDHIPTVYSAGYSSDHYYIAMELINGENLEDAISKKEFSLEKGVDILLGISEGVSYAHDHGIEHNDIKLENIVFGTTYMVDFGGRLTKTNSNDIIAVGQVGKILLDKHQGEIPNRLQQIIEKALNNKYDNINELKKEIKNYKSSITRRKFLKTAGSLTALSALSYGGFRFLDYKNSLENIVDRINDTESTSYNEINPLFDKLLLKIIDHKIDWLTEIIPKNKFPYATIQNGTWFLTDGGNWSDGLWSGILWECYKVTGNKKYRNLAEEQTRSIRYTDFEKDDMRSIRFYHSYAKGYELTQDEFFKNIAIEASGFMANRFNKIGGFIQPFGSIDESFNNKEITIDHIELSLPLLWFNEKYHEIAFEHAKTSLLNVKEDGSTRRISIFNPKTRELLGEKNNRGYGDNSTYSRGQAYAIKGFALAYKKTSYEQFLSTAEKLADYFISHLPLDYIPYYDLNDPNQGIPKDSSAATIATSGLLDLFEITGKEKYRKAAYNILKSLSSKDYLSTDLSNYQGIIMHACDNKIQKQHLDSSLIFGDYYFIKSLRKIKK